MIAVRNMRLRLTRLRSDDGIAMVMVIGLAAVMMVLVTLALSVSLSGVVKTKSDENWNGAITAAYAGIDDYKSKIANDNTYYQYGNAAAEFTKKSNSKVIPPVDGNPAFGSGPTGTWASVPNPDGSPSPASYRYEVDSSEYANSGVLRIRSTGRVGNETRSVVANLKQKGFIDFLYYTTYEIQDREISGDPVACEKYWWNGRDDVTAGCSEIAFGANDVLTGPVHSNDAMRVCGATFTGTVTTSYQPASGERWRRVNSNNSSSGCATNPFKTAPAYSIPLNMPPTNSAMRNEVRTDLAEVQRPGCLYTGPTSIKFNSDGTMTIRSPWTKATRVNGSPATSGETPTECGTPGTAVGNLGHPNGQTLDVPARNLIYVQNVPFGTPGAGKDPNLWPSNSTASYPIKTGTTRYTAAECAASNFVGYPRTSEYVASVTKSYGCSNGDVFIEGSLHAQTTVVTDNYVYVTGDITYVNPESDVLGLVGQNAVFVWNPVSRSGSNGNYSYSSLLPNNRTISAALLSVAHTVQVQNYDKGGDQGTLTIKGAIAQKFRGIVRNGSNGFAKNYLYDERFRYVAPPKFLSPVSTTYGVSVLVEVKTAYNPDGTDIP